MVLSLPLRRSFCDATYNLINQLDCRARTLVRQCLPWVASYLGCLWVSSHDQLYPFLTRLCSHAYSAGQNRDNVVVPKARAKVSCLGGAEGAVVDGANIKGRKLKLTRY